MVEEAAVEACSGRPLSSCISYSNIDGKLTVFNQLKHAANIFAVRVRIGSSCSRDD